MTLYQWFTILGLPTISGLIIRLIQINIQNKMDERKEREIERQQQKETNRAILRIILRSMGEKYLKRGFASLAEKDDFEECYKQYHNNGGNGIMDALREDVLDLPQEG